MAHSEQLRAEAERLLWRYVVEVVERFGLCPWARRARERGEIRVEVIHGEAEVVAAVARIADDPRAVMGMVVLPGNGIDATALRRLRDRVLASRAAAAATPVVGIADFHPEAALDQASPARLVPWLRRAPDPTLQVVRLDVLAGARAAPPPPARAAQAAILAGRAEPPAAPAADQIAAANLRTALADAAAIADAVAAIHADRDRSYTAIRASCR